MHSAHWRAMRSSRSVLEVGTADVRPDWRDALLAQHPGAYLVVDSRSGVVQLVSDLLVGELGLSEGELLGRQLDELMGSGAIADLWRDASVHEVTCNQQPALLLVVEAWHDARLQRVRDELAEFPQANPGPVLRLSKDGRVQLANEAASRLFARRELTGLSWADLCPGLTPEHWADLLDLPGPVTYETKVGDLHVSFAHVHRPARDVVFVYGTDVTRLRHQEEQLAEMARFPDMNPGPVLRLDLAGGVVLLNLAAKELLPDLSVGSSWLEHGPGVDARFWAAAKEAEAPIVMEARIDDRDYQFTHRVDPGRYVFVYGADITAQKAAEHTARDSERLATLGTLAAGVTHELNNPAAAARRASAHLAVALARMRRTSETINALGFSAAARALITQFEERAQNAARLAHALTAIQRADREDEVSAWLGDHDSAGRAADLAREWVGLGFGIEELAELSEIVGASLPDAVDRIVVVADVVALVDQVARATERVSEIALALKRYTYLGQAEVIDVDIHQALKDTLLLLSHKLDGDTRVTRDFAAEPLTVWGIGSELNQVWMNLIDNAIDASGPNGHLVLRTRSLPRLDGMWVVVEVEDDGPGVPTEVQSRVFEPFFTTKPPGSGTGLGLATSWSIVVDRHHGTLVVDSQPRRTVFTVSLPVSRAVSSPLSDSTAFLISKQGDGQ